MNNFSVPPSQRELTALEAQLSGQATPAYINAVGTAVPEHNFHDVAIDWLERCIPEARRRGLFRRMAEISGITQRWTVMSLMEMNEFYNEGRNAPTSKRMELYEREAPKLAMKAIGKLDEQLGKDWHGEVTHIIITSCTGFYAPGLDLDIQRMAGLPDTVERTIIGFMGCNAAFNGLKAARNIVGTNPDARVLMLNVELCSLHLRPVKDVEQALLFALFADGAAATLITADPVGLSLDHFSSKVLPECDELMSWRIKNDGFDMTLSGAVPPTIRRHIAKHMDVFCDTADRINDIVAWAVHPGGRSIIDAVQSKLQIAAEKVQASREVLNGFGNMSSATVMFVISEVLNGTGNGGKPPKRGDPIFATGFGPGLTVESCMMRMA